MYISFIKLRLQVVPRPVVMQLASKDVNVTSEDIDGVEADENDDDAWKNVGAAIPQLCSPSPQHWSPYGSAIIFPRLESRESEADI